MGNLNSEIVEKQKSAFTQDEDGYYKIRLFYLVQTLHYFGKGETIQEAIDNCKEASSGRFNKSDPHIISTYIVTNPDIEVSKAMEDAIISYTNITYKTENIQLVSNQRVNVK
jgi:hypothetical protein